MSHNISIIGCGFAALTAARRLRKLDGEAAITLIAPRAELIYLPSLIWLPSGKRKPQDLVVPLDKFLRAQRIRFVAGEATGMEDGGRTVLTSVGPIANDGLVIACGGRFIKKLPGIDTPFCPARASRPWSGCVNGLPLCNPGRSLWVLPATPTSRQPCAADRSSSFCSGSTPS